MVERVGGYFTALEGSYPVFSQMITITKDKNVFLYEHSLFLFVTLIRQAVLQNPIFLLLAFSYFHSREQFGRLLFPSYQSLPKPRHVQEHLIFQKSKTIFLSSSH